MFSNHRDCRDTRCLAAAVMAPARTTRRPPLRHRHHRLRRRSTRCSPRSRTTCLRQPAPSRDAIPVREPHKGCSLTRRIASRCSSGSPGSQVPTLLRVAPGDADNSYLIQKLEGNASVGGQMPLGGTPLPPDQINTVRQWIIDGATDDRPPATSPIRVSSLSVVPDSVLDAGPDEIIAGFDRELDASTVNANTFST